MPCFPIFSMQSRYVYYIMLLVWLVLVGTIFTVSSANSLWYLYFAIELAWFVMVNLVSSAKRENVVAYFAFVLMNSLIGIMLLLCLSQSSVCAFLVVFLLKFGLFPVLSVVFNYISIVRVPFLLNYLYLKLCYFIIFRGAVYSLFYSAPTHSVASLSSSLFSVSAPFSMLSSATLFSASSVSSSLLYVCPTTPALFSPLFLGSPGAIVSVHNVPLFSSLLAALQHNILSSSLLSGVLFSSSSVASSQNIASAASSSSSFLPHMYDVLFSASTPHSSSTSSPALYNSAAGAAGAHSQPTVSNTISNSAASEHIYSSLDISASHTIPSNTISAAISSLAQSGSSSVAASPNSAFSPSLRFSHMYELPQFPHISPFPIFSHMYEAQRALFAGQHIHSASSSFSTAPTHIPAVPASLSSPLPTSNIPALPHISCYSTPCHTTSNIHSAFDIPLHPFSDSSSLNFAALLPISHIHSAVVSVPHYLAALFSPNSPYSVFSGTHIHSATHVLLLLSLASLFLLSLVISGSGLVSFNLYSLVSSSFNYFIVLLLLVVSASYALFSSLYIVFYTALTSILVLVLLSAATPNIASLSLYSSLAKRSGSVFFTIPPCYIFPERVKRACFSFPRALCLLLFCYGVLAAVLIWYGLLATLFNKRSDHVVLSAGSLYAAFYVLSMPCYAIPSYIFPELRCYMLLFYFIFPSLLLAVTILLVF